LVVTAALVTAIARRGGPEVWHRVAHGYVLLITAGVLSGLVFRRPPELQLSGRFMWLYGHPVVAGSLLTVSSLFLLAWVLDRTLPRSLPDPLYPALLVVHSVALLATETRGSVIAAAAGAATMVWLWATGSRRADLTLLAVVGLPAVLALGWPLLRAFALRGESINQLRGLNSRADLWTEAAAAVAAKPLQGQGYFASRQIFLDSIGLGGAHNAFIEVAISAGLIGLACFVALLVGTVRRLGAADRHPDRPLLGGVLVALLVNGLTAQYFAQAGTGANVIFLLVIAWAATLPAGRVATRG
jgi:O-antigen ligase